jgi:putative transposon-encoded protein
MWIWNGDSRCNEEGKAAAKERVHKVQRKPDKGKKSSAEVVRGRAKFEVYGEEMLEKKVSVSGNSGRIYLPPDWIGRHVKIIRID